LAANKVIIVRDNEGQELKRFSFENRDKAFTYLKELEEWGVQAVLDEPSLPETLINSLGANDEDRQQLKQSIKDELEDHDDSCCFEKTVSKEH
jgi:hypothetical protein